MRDGNLSDFERGIIENVDRHGCQVNHVFDPDEEVENFSYSIGFPLTVGQPEVIVFGLPKNLMHFMINDCLRQCRDGLRLEDGVVIDGLIEGFSCIVREVPAQSIVSEYFSSAIWFAKYRATDRGLSACQIVWPDAKNGLFPWDVRATAEFAAIQPRLYEGSVH